MDLLLLRRALGPLTLVSGALTLVALMSSSLLAAPSALLFVGAAFLWGLSRADGPRLAGAGCSGCSAGCARCRERIDAR